MGKPVTMTFRIWSGLPYTLDIYQTVMHFCRSAMLIGPEHRVKATMLLGIYHTKADQAIGQPVTSFLMCMVSMAQEAALVTEAFIALQEAQWAMPEMMMTMNGGKLDVYFDDVDHNDFIQQTEMWRKQLTTDMADIHSLLFFCPEENGINRYRWDSPDLH